MEYRKIGYRIKYQNNYVKKILISELLDGTKYYTPIMTTNKKLAEIYTEGVMEILKGLNETYERLGNIRFELEEVKDERY